MEIKLDDEWFVEDTGDCYILTHYTGKINEKTNARLYDYQVYPSTLAQAIEIYARKKVISANDQLTLQNYAKQIKEIFNEIKASLDFRGRG